MTGRAAPTIDVARARDLLDDGGPGAGDTRFLIDRLWPRGIRKDRLALTGWPKAATPSTELRQAYHHGEIDHDEFARRYRAELEDSGAAGDLLEQAADATTITLVTAVRDLESSHVPILVAALEEAAR